MEIISFGQAGPPLEYQGIARRCQEFQKHAAEEILFNEAGMLFGMEELA